MEKTIVTSLTEPMLARTAAPTLYHLPVGLALTVPLFRPAAAWQEFQPGLIVLLLCGLGAALVTGGLVAAGVVLLLRRRPDLPQQPPGYPARTQAPRAIVSPPPAAVVPPSAPPAVARARPQPAQPTSGAPAYRPPSQPPAAPSSHKSRPPLPSAGAAALTVLYSDDTAMLRQALALTGDRVYIGRSPQNDLVFAKDTPVSRQHALIERRDGQFWLSEVVSQDEGGAQKRPRFGTYVNETLVGDRPVPLRNGDVIRLGPRARLEVRIPPSPATDSTVDGLAALTGRPYEPAVGQEPPPQPVEIPPVVEAPAPVIAEVPPGVEEPPPADFAADAWLQSPDPDRPAGDNQTMVG